jgi:hypothetical protein
LQLGIKREMESELIQVEAQAAILIAHENVDAMKAQDLVLAGTASGAIRTVE